MKRVKVCYVITRLIRGGAAIVAMAQATGLDRGRFDVTLACGPEDPEGKTLIDDARAAGLRVEVIPGLVRGMSPRHDFSAFCELRRLFGREGFSIVHTHTSKAGIVGRFVARAARVPVIVHSPHGHIYGRDAEIPGVTGHPARRRFFWHVERVANSITDKVVTLTEKNRREQAALGLGPPSKFTAIPNGIDPARFSDAKGRCDAVRRELGIPRGAFVAGMVGRLTSEKGHSIFLKAAAKMKEAEPGMRFLIVGEGPLMDSLKKEAGSLGLDEVIFLGMREDVPEVLAAMDLLVLPSLYEGLGLAALEAMASSLPVIANRVGGVPEVVEDGSTGILVEPGNVGELAEAVLGLVHDRHRAGELGAAGCDRVCRHFTCDLMNRRIDALYKGLLKKKGLS